ncbi:MAG: hypothetical protein K0B11_08600 [Mariniphaga sp.]|nr:hypothetical protein [Mariniphaga sp.]
MIGDVLNELVSQSFFTVLVVKKQTEVVNAQKKVLTEKLVSAESAVRNGIAEKTTALEIRAEILNLEQHKIQLDAAKNSAIQMLSILTGKAGTHITAGNDSETGRNFQPKHSAFAHTAGSANQQTGNHAKNRPGIG